jgi:predicted N-acyltransferase
MPKYQVITANRYLVDAKNEEEAKTLVRNLVESGDEEDVSSVTFLYADHHLTKEIREEEYKEVLQSMNW